MLSTLDLSSVTNRLIEVLQTANNTSLLWDVNGGPVAKFTIDITGQMPEQVRNDGDCQLTAYLFHVAVEPYTRNMPLTVQAAQPNRRQALGLSLYYLVSAFAKNAPEQEQQAMSIALKALHERPTYVDPINGFTFTITAEAEKSDEANRRWQAFSTPFRLSTVYRVSVAFLTPQTNPPALAAPPTRLGLTASPPPCLSPRAAPWSPRPRASTSRRSRRRRATSSPTISRPPSSARAVRSPRSVPTSISPVRNDSI